MLDSREMHDFSNKRGHATGAPVRIKLRTRMLLNLKCNYGCRFRRGDVPRGSPSLRTAVRLDPP
jgi:hypothetical protein